MAERAVVLVEDGIRSKPFIHQGTGGKKERCGPHHWNEIQVFAGFIIEMIEASDEIDEGKKSSNPAAPPTMSVEIHS